MEIDIKNSVAIKFIEIGKGYLYMEKELNESLKFLLWSLS
jgi:hypothetical protein